MIGAAQSAALAVQIAPKLAKLRKATDGMQAAFVKTLVAEMRKSNDSEFKDVPGNEIYEDMVNQVLAEKLGSSGHLGLSEAMFKPMAKLAIGQEVSNMKKDTDK